MLKCEDLPLYRLMTGRAITVTVAIASIEWMSVKLLVRSQLDTCSVD